MATVANGGRAVTAGALADAPGRGAIVSGSTVFHSPQVSHLPAHFGVTAPQDWQTKRVVTLAKETPGWASAFEWSPAR